MCCDAAIDSSNAFLKYSHPFSSRSSTLRLLQIVQLFTNLLVVFIIIKN